MQAVNLLPRDFAQKRKSRLSEVPSRRMLQAGAAVSTALAVLMAGLYLYERSVVHDKKSELAHDQARLVALNAQAAPIRAQQADAAARLAVVERITSTRMNWDRTMGDLARVLPVDAYLTSLQASAPTTAPPAAATDTTPQAAPAPSVPTATTLELTGVAPGHVRVATVLDKLALLPWLTNINLASSTRQADTTTLFDISGSVSEVH